MSLCRYVRFDLLTTLASHTFALSTRQRYGSVWLKGSAKGLGSSPLSALTEDVYHAYRNTYPDILRIAQSAPGRVLVTTHDRQAGVVAPSHSTFPRQASHGPCGSLARCSGTSGRESRRASGAPGLGSPRGVRVAFRAT